MEHCWGKKKCNKPRQKSLCRPCETQTKTGGGGSSMWSHAASTNAEAPYGSQVQIPQTELCCPHLDFTAAHRKPPGGQPGELGFGGGHLIPSTECFVSSPRTDPLQMQDYSSATGKESPIAPLQVDNANSHQARQRQCTCCARLDPFHTVDTGRLNAHWGCSWPVHTARYCCHR